MGGIKKPERFRPFIFNREQRETVKWRLKLNRLLQSECATNNILNHCLPDIINLFGGINNILNFISSNANSENNKSIHNIISKQIIKDDESNNENKLKNDERIDKKQDMFNVIPNECISYLAGYLERRDIKSFKLTSRQIAIVSLDEMDKISIGIINLNHLITNYRVNVLNRYPSSMKYRSLYQDWYKTYNIPEQNQLILTMSPDGITSIDSSKLRDITIQRSNYFILDNRNITILEDTKQRKYNVEHDSFEKLNNYELIILEYFDIYQQKIHFAQFLLCQGAISQKRLFEYIEKKFIIIDGIDNDWYYRLKSYLNKMGHDSNHCKLSLYQHDKIRNERIKHILRLNIEDKITCWDLTTRIFTFQLNTNPRSLELQINHPSSDVFYLNAQSFYNSKLPNNPWNKEWFEWD